MKIYCPKCNSEYDVDSDLAGKMADCGSCGEKFLIQETIFLSSNNKKETKKLPLYRKIIVIFGALFVIMAIIILVSGMKISNGELFFNQDYIKSFIIFAVGGIFCTFAPFCKKS